MTHTATIVVAHTWNGTPIPAAEHVRWRLTATLRDLALEVDAPLHGDPAPAEPHGDPAPAEPHGAPVPAKPHGAPVPTKLHGDPATSLPPGPTPGLWRYEVVELFVAGWADGAGDAVPYTEIELGPHGHHLVLRFRGVRNEVASALAIDYRASRGYGRWRGRARVPWSYLPAPPWTMNAYAIAGPAEARRYRAAVPVPGTRPDFHQPQVFVPLRLTRPDQST